MAQFDGPYFTSLFSYLWKPFIHIRVKISYHAATKHEVKQKKY